MIKVGIVGGTGYTGVELLRLLATHPQVQLIAVTSRKEDGMPIADMYPSLRGRVALAFSSPEKAQLKECDVVFFATPHGVAMAQAPELLAAGVKVIDLAADFRLQDTAVFEKWYKLSHSCPELLKEAAYGLPELNRAEIKEARIVGVLSIATVKVIAAGIDACNIGNNARTRATVARIFAPGCRLRISITAGSPFITPKLRISCTESSTLATSPSRTGAPLL